MNESHLTAVSLLLPPATPVTAGEAASAPEWRAVSADPGNSPVDMAVEVGRPAVARSGAPASSFDWLIHTGSGHQGVRSWPLHHAVQAGVLGSHGNAFELRQFCAGGLTSWMMARAMRRTGRYVVCTAADNWSWTDRFALSRDIAGEPMADVASAAVVGPGGFARILGAATASVPEQAEAWRSDHPHWHAVSKDEYHAVYAEAMGRRNTAAMQASVAMIGRAIGDALTASGISPAEVTTFVPPSSRLGQPYRYLANRVGLPWDEDLYRSHLEHGYLSVSAQAAALMFLAERDQLPPGTNILLLATEYNVSATAMVVRIVRAPNVLAEGRVRMLLAGE